MIDGAEVPLDPEPEMLGGGSSSVVGVISVINIFKSLSEHSSLG